MVTLLLVACLFVSQKDVLSEPLCDLCKEHVPTNDSQNILRKFCNNTPFSQASRTLNGRCCFDGDVVNGIDLSNCDLKSISGIFVNTTSVNWIAINDNNQLKLKDNDFRSLLDLAEIVVSNTSSCPGGDLMWRVNKVVNSVRDCATPLDSCSALNVSCPENSHCLEDGPALSMCQCDSGFHGYRCLREGSFPVLPWAIGYIVATIVICVALHMIQRPGLRYGKELKSSMRNQLVSPVSVSESTDSS